MLIFEKKNKLKQQIMANNAIATEYFKIAQEKLNMQQSIIDLAFLIASFKNRFLEHRWQQIACINEWKSNKQTGFSL